MTPTTSEREARELLAREYESRGWQNLARRARTVDLSRQTPVPAAVSAIIAALTRREAQQEARKGALDELARENERLGLSYADAPQQEAQGAVAVSWSDYWQRKGETALSHDYAAFERADEWRRAATPPAPVDVRGLRALAEGWRKEANGWLLQSDPTELLRDCAASLLALIDGQPAGVVIDDAMVRRAVHAYDEWMIEHAPDETDAYHDGMRAALTAALGGGWG